MIQFAITETNKQPDTQFELPLFFSDRMVFQAKKPVRFWGKYAVDGGVAVIIQKDGQAVHTVYGEICDGRFDLTLPEMPYGGPYTLCVIAEKGGCRELNDVLFGEVILCAGQSNMQWPMMHCFGATMEQLRYQEEIDRCENPMIRQFRVESRQKLEPTTELDGFPSEEWRAADPNNVLIFSAVGYFFAREMYQTLHVPIGLVLCCEGGTRVQTWIPPQEFETLGLDEADLKLLEFDGTDYSSTNSIWYNAKIHPLLPMTVRGAIWYQGEGNPIGLSSAQGVAAHGYRPYAEYLKLVIEGWRRAFEQPDMPFAIAQLPRHALDLPVWFFSREEDKRVCSLVEHTACSINIDTGLYPISVAPGDPNNEGHGIHPYQKEEVGIRLAKVFMNAFMGVEGLCSGPVLEEIVPGKTQVVLTYSNVAEGLCLTGELAGFEIAGFDGVFHDARPELVNDHQVRLSCADVVDPVWVRYGYSNTSSLITKPLLEAGQSVCLFNSENGAPAFPAEQFWQRLL